MSEALIESIVNGDLDVELVAKWLREEPVQDGSTVPQVLSDVSRKHFAAVLLHYIHSRTDHVVAETSGELNALTVDRSQPTAGSTVGTAATPPNTSRGRGRRSPAPRTSCLGDFITRTTHTQKKRGGNKNTSSDSVESPNAETNRLRQANGTPTRVTDDTDATLICGTRQPQENTNTDKNIISPSDKKRVTPICVKSPLNVTPVRVMARMDATTGHVTTQEKSSEINKTPSIEKKRITPVNVTPKTVKSPVDVTSSHFETPEPVTPDGHSAKHITPLPLSTPVTPWSDRWSPSSEGSVMTPMTPLTTTPMRVTPVSETGDASPFDRHRNRCPPRALLTAFDAPTEDQPRLPTAVGPSLRLTRLYCAVLDANLTTGLPHEIAWLGSLLSCGDEATALFACQSLYEQRRVLRLVLDSTGLRALAEHHMVSRLCPSLSSWATSELSDRSSTASHTCGGGDATSNGAGRFHADTDGAGSFGSPHSFNAARKQRDQLHEVIRWWRGGGSLQGPSALSSRGRALLMAGRSCPDATARLADLTVSLLCGDIALHHQHHGSDTQSKLHKLRRRLTAPAAPTASKLVQGEAFYRELISCMDQCAWRRHVADALANELGNMLGVTTQPTTAEEAHGLVRSVCALGRLLGVVAALPYSCAETTATSTAQQPQPTRPRPYWQPGVDLCALVSLSASSGRVTLGVAMLLHWLTELDVSTRGTPYCQRLRGILSRFYEDLPNQSMPDVTRVFLTWVVSCTLSLPTPGASGVGSDVSSDSEEVDLRLVVSSEGIDGSGALDWAALLECCPQHKGILGPMVPGNGPSNIGRHVRPVTLPVDPNQKDRELQSRLEWQLLVSAGTGVRRALELCEERAAASAARKLMATVSETRQTARQRLRDVIAQHTQTPPLAFLEQELRSSLTHAVSVALSSCCTGAREHAMSAAVALLGPLPSRDALAAVAARRAKRRLQRWAETHCTPDTICPDMSAEVRSVIELSTTSIAAKASATATTAVPPTAIDDEQRPSMAETLITLKECIAECMEGVSSPAVPGLVPVLCRLAGTAIQPPHATLLLHGTLDLCVAMASFTPRALTPSLLSSLSPVWSSLCPPAPSPTSPPPSPPAPSPSPSQDRAPTPPSSDDDGTTPTRVVINAAPRSKDTPRPTETVAPSETLLLASRLLCPRNIHMLHLGPGNESYAAWQRLIRHLLSLGVLSPSSVTSCGLRLYGLGRPAWPPKALVSCRAALTAAASVLPTDDAASLLLVSEYATEPELPELH